MESNVTIVGAGVIGLAIASEISERKEKIFLLERNRTFGQETSSRNSEVIHSGIYYPRGTLKARLCVEGRNLLYKLCVEKEIPYRKCGKLIVATHKDEIAKLEEVKQKGEANGVDDLRYVEGQELKDLEPNVKAVKALFFPSTGIIDSYSLMKYLESNAKRNGTEFAYGVNVTGIEKIKNGYQVNIHDADGQPFSFTTRFLINSAGLEADIIAKSIGINQKEYNIYFWKGEYFYVGSGKNRLIKRLVYPVPEEYNIGLGIHATIDLSGRLRLGPNTEFIPEKKIDYSVKKENQQAFFESARKFLPFLEYEDLGPDMAGIRPKLQKPGDPVKDFIIREESGKGYPGLINLLGIESPGLTACLSIGKYVVSLLNRI